MSAADGRGRRQNGTTTSRRSLTAGARRDQAPGCRMERSNGPDPHGLPDRLCALLTALRLWSIHEPCLFRALLAHPCWRSRAASLATSMRIPDVLFVLFPRHPSVDIRSKTSINPAISSFVPHLYRIL